MLLLRGQGRYEHCARAGHNVSHELHFSRVAWRTLVCHHILLTKNYTAHRNQQKLNPSSETCACVVNCELCSRSTPGPLTQQMQPGMCADGNCASWKWLGGLAEQSSAASWSIKSCSKSLHTAPQAPKLLWHSRKIG